MTACESESVIVIGEPAVSIKVVENHTQQVCLGIFSETGEHSGTNVRPDSDNAIPRIAGLDPASGLAT